jgi:hypothetical protein
MSKKPDPLLMKLDTLIEKLNVLTMLLATKPNNEKLKGLLKNRNQKEQIRILKEYNFPTEIIALMIGTTLNTARVRVSEMESEGKKGKQKEKESKNEQRPEGTS